ncbi:MAG: carbon-nitrogen hydrolase family protein [bacterium]|nr:carbon-nitrogen hydrolase family protein [bacterium]
MPATRDPLRVAAAQKSSVFLNRRASVEKACTLIAEASWKGAELIVFPEAFVPGYPDWVWLVKNSDGAALNAYYRELLENAVTIPDEFTEQLCEAARAGGIHVAIGVNERNAEASCSSLFNTLLYISDEGIVLGAHRKLMPTGGERTVWGQGDGTTLHAFDTPIGKLGGLLCWENYMPLARQAMYQMGVQIHVAPTWDSSEPWLLAMRHIAREGGMFVVNCCQALRVEEIPESYEFRKLYPEDREWVNQGNSCVIDPMGKVLVGPAKGTQEILYADLDLDLVPAAKRMFDSAGHYARPDVFRFEVNRGE